jgi:predicted ArsR family transcriptional regulator
MKRNDFLKTCGAGVCGCGVLGWLAPLSASAEGKSGQAAPVPAEVAQLKERLEAAHERFAKLVTIMGEDLGGDARDKILARLGQECAQDYKALFQKYRGDLPGFLAKIKTSWVEKAEFDEKTGILRIVGKPSPCVCPLVKAGRTPADFCNCTLGWQQAAFSAVTGKPVTAEIEETVLRGGKRCSFRIGIKA